MMFNSLLVLSVSQETALWPWKCHILVALIIEVECAVRKLLDKGGSNSQHFSVL